MTRYFYAQQFSEDMHVTNFVKTVVHATTQSPILCKDMTLLHKQQIISANPNPILKQITDI